MSSLDQQLDKILGEMMPPPTTPRDAWGRSKLIEKAKKDLKQLITQIKDQAIEEFIFDGWGARCQVKDIEEFPELKAGERCAGCEMWEHYDEFKKEKRKENTKQSKSTNNLTKEKP